MKKKILVELSSAGHYSSKFVYITADEKNKLEAIQETYGYLCASVDKNDKKFIANIMNDRAEVDIPLIRYYE